MAKDEDYKNELLAAQQEWSEIPQTGDSINNEDNKLETTDFIEVNAKELKDEIIPENSRKLVASTIDDDDHEEPCCCLCPKRKIPEELEHLRKSYLFMTSSKFSATNQIHINSLLSIYTKLKSSKNNVVPPPPRFGKHWEKTWIHSRIHHRN